MRSGGVLIEDMATKKSDYLCLLLPHSRGKMEEEQRKWSLMAGEVAQLVKTLVVRCEYENWSPCEELAWRGWLTCNANDMEGRYATPGIFFLPFGHAYV